MEVIIDFFLALDERIFLYLNNLGSLSWDSFWLFITNKWASIPLYILLLYFLRQNTDIQQFALIVFLIILLITFTDQTANLFKNNFQRLRPCNLPLKDRSIANCGRFGFFSAHAASSMALAIFVGCILRPSYKYILPVLILWSLLLGYSRIYVGVHFPGDVLVGFAFGVFYGTVFLYLKKYLARFSLLPQTQKKTIS